jgi:hypothetical protein
MTELEELVLDAYKQGMVDAQATIAGFFEQVGKPDTQESKVLSEVGVVIRQLDLLKDKSHPPERFRDKANGE